MIMLALLIVVTRAWGIDAYSKIPHERPQDLDLSATVTSAGRFFEATYILDQDCAPLNKFHSWVLRLLDKENQPMKGVNIEFVTDMPEHLHGMMTKPQVSESSNPGEYLVEGVRFHMPGWWEITLDATRDGGRDLARFNILVGEGYCHPE